MNDSQSPAARREAAAGWYAELQDEHLADDVWRRFLAWERDPLNAAAFREIEAALSVIDRTRLGVRPRPVRQAAIWTGAVAAAAAVMIGAFVFLSGPDVPAAIDSPAETYATAIGEQREVRLADGSAVTLNTASEIEVAVTPEARTVRLRAGQALFEVAPGEAPFTVEAGAGRTTALGTVFDVRLNPDGFAVTLVEGSVSVAPAKEGEAHLLKPGQQLRASGSGISLADIDTSLITSWQSGMLPFRDVTLAEAIAELNRYSTVQLVVTDPGLAAERLSGVFPAGKPDVFAETLAQFLPITAERAGDEIILRPAR